MVEELSHAADGAAAMDTTMERNEPNKQHEDAEVAAPPQKERNSKRRSAEETRQYERLKKQRQRESLSSSARSDIQAVDTSAQQLAREQHNATAEAPTTAGTCSTLFDTHHLRGNASLS